LQLEKGMRMMKYKTLNIKGKLFSLERPVVMGILNVTPDSFYPKSRQQSDDAVVERIETIISEGGALIDVGGYSTRPDATEVTPEEEWRRLEPALILLQKKYAEMPASIDTFRADLAERAVKEYGVAMINDVSGGAKDDNMFETVAAFNVPYILTHYRYTSDTMRQYTDNELSLEDVMLYFAEKLQTLRSLGVNDVILDPGFGFNKTLEQNYALMRSLQNFNILFDCPLMVGVSRKSMIYNVLNCSAEDSLNGTTVLNTYSLLSGADILRVHDVKAAVEVVKLVDQLKC